MRPTLPILLRDKVSGKGSSPSGSTLRRGSACSARVVGRGKQRPYAGLQALGGAGLVFVVLAAASHTALALSFECETLGPNGRNPFAVVAGDWNKDGKDDLAVSYAGAGSVIPFLNEGPRRYRQMPEAPSGQVARGISVGDVNGDGWLDMVVSNATSSDVAVLYGDGKGGFRRVAQLAAGMSPFHSALGDFDGDGIVDLAVVNESNWPWKGKPGTVSVFFGTGGGAWSPKVDLTAGDHPSAIAVANLDGHDGPDLAVTNWQSDTVSIFVNNGDRSFRHHAEVPISGGPCYSVFPFDFDGDGVIDLAVADVGAAAVHVLFGDGQGNFGRPKLLRVGNGVRDVTGGDVNGDGQMDLVTADTASGTVSVILGQGKGEFAPAASFNVGLGPRMVIARDLDGDGKVDIGVTAGGGTAILLYQTSGPGKPCPSGATPAKPSAKRSTPPQ